MCLQKDTTVTFPPVFTVNGQRPKRRRRRKNKSNVVDGSTTTTTTTTALCDNLNLDLPQENDASCTSPSPPKKRNKPKRRRRRSRKTSSGGGSSGTDNGGLIEDGRHLYVALDCEMVGVGPGGYTSALARVCLVNYDEDVLLDTFVKVTEPITDYRTFVSGIREEDMQSENAMDFDECRMALASLLAGKVLIGHALKNDLRALQLHHPWYDTRDTAKYEPFMKQCEITETLKARKLRDLVKEKLQITIQPDGQEHSPYEDAVGALNLFKLASEKWEKVMQYKMNKTKEIKNMRSEFFSYEQFASQ